MDFSRNIVISVKLRLRVGVWKYNTSSSSGKSKGKALDKKKESFYEKKHFFPAAICI